MRGIKPLKLSFLARPFQSKGVHRLGVAVIAYFPLDAPPSLLPDLELWSDLPEVLGPQTVIDECIPKSRAEFLVSGTAYQPGAEALPIRHVRARVGSLEKSLYVVGDRVWRKNNVPTKPEPFERMPLGWEQAFGGEDFERNPLGKGYGEVELEGGEKVRPLPNVELPGEMIKSRRDHPDPASFGPIDFVWPQRFSRAGTYDKKWLKEDFPGFAEDMDWRIWQRASPDQWQDEPFVGDEEVLLEHLHPDEPALRGKLPGVRARCFVVQRTDEGGILQDVPLKLTTVWLLPEIKRGVLVFHGSHRVAEDDADDIETLMIAAERLQDEPLGLEHYRHVLQRRLGPDAGLQALNDGDLVPKEFSAPGAEMSRQAELTTIEQLQYKRQRKAADATIAEARLKLEELGLDPDEHGPKVLEPDPPLPSAAEVPALLEKLLALAEEKKEEVAGKREQSLEQLKVFCEEMGLKYEDMLAELDDTRRGPPKFSADGQRAKMRLLADEAAALGQPEGELEYFATHEDPYARWLDAEEKQLQLYRAGAHHQKPAYTLDEQASAERREAVLTSIKARDPLIGWDLTGVDLSGMNLSGVDLTMALMESVNLSGATLDGANLQGVVLAHSNLRGASFQNADLSHANLGFADLTGVNMRAAKLVRSRLDGVELTDAQFEGADLNRVSFQQCALSGVNFLSANLEHATFDKTPLRSVVFRGANLTHALFTEADVSALDFGGATLESTTFLKCRGEGAQFIGVQAPGLRLVESDFRRADFSGACLRAANLREANLEEANLSMAQLSGADLSKANLRKARLYRAVAKGALWIRTDLREAMMVSIDLFESLLSKADIRGADLRGSNLHGSDFSLVRSDSATNVTDAIQTRVRIHPQRDQSQPVMSEHGESS